MGSSFSLVNDTEEAIWVSHGICHNALYGSVAGILALAALALSVAAGASTRVAAKVATTTRLATTAAAGPDGRKTLNTVIGLLKSSLENLPGEEKQNLLTAKEQLEERLKGYTRVEPGDKYTVNGSLSLVLTGYVIYNDGREATCDSWTAPTDGGNKEYNVSKYF